jgi:hypothetical protein
MGTIDQPKPSEPKSPVPNQQPLQPGGTTESGVNSFSPQRNNPQTPETVREESGEEEHRRHG